MPSATSNAARCPTGTPPIARSARGSAAAMAPPMCADSMIIMMMTWLPAAAALASRTAGKPAVAAAIAKETEGDDLAPTATAEAAARGTGATRREKFAAALAAASGTGITRGALADASGYSTSLVSAELKRLAERGAATSRDQRWFPVPGRDVRAEMEAARAGDDALLHLVS